MSFEHEFRLSDRYQQLKSALHLHLMALLEDRGIDIGSWSDAKAAEYVRGQARAYVTDHRLPINSRKSICWPTIHSTSWSASGCYRC